MELGYNRLRAQVSLFFLASDRRCTLSDSIRSNVDKKWPGKLLRNSLPRQLNVLSNTYILFVYIPTELSQEVNNVFPLFVLR